MYCPRECVQMGSRHSALDLALQGLASLLPPTNRAAYWHDKLLSATPFLELCQSHLHCSGVVILAPKKTLPYAIPSVVNLLRDAGTYASPN